MRVSKSIGDICDIICGQDHKSVQDANGKYPIYGTGGIMGYASQSRCPANSIIIGRKGSINNPLFVQEAFWNVDTAFGVVPNTSVIVPKYFFYFCRHYDFTIHDVSVTLPSLRRSDIVKIQVPVPSLEEQERIVAELDLLTGIIDKHKAQLKELDTLAQSIFYDMFGNPDTNEKGWEVKPLMDLCTRITDGSHFSPKEDAHGKYPMLSVRDMMPNGFCYDSCKYISKIDYDSLVSNGCKPSVNDVLVAKDGSYLKTAFVNKKDIEQVVLSSIAILSPRIENINPEYLAFFFTTPHTKKAVEKHYLTGTAIKRVILKGFRVLPISLPPLMLQESFAQKIQSIEQQKKSINRSIAETQKLFDYTMDKYFG